MKRILLALAVGFLFTANLSAKKASPLTVKEGSVSVLKEAAKAVLITDYSETYVGKEGERTAALADFLKERGEDHVNDWPKDVMSASRFFIYEFNKKNKRGLQIVEDEGENSVQYRLVLKIDTMDWGMNGIGMISPFASKAGGFIIWGEFIIKKVEDDSVVAKITIDTLKGNGSVNDTNRLMFLYKELVTELFKLK